MRGRLKFLLLFTPLLLVCKPSSQPYARVLVDLSHSQESYWEMERYEFWDYDIIPLLRFLEHNGFSVTVNHEEQLSSSLLSGYDILILPQPYEELTTDEENVLVNFVGRGGGLLLIPYYVPSAMESVTSVYGFTFTDWLVNSTPCGIFHIEGEIPQLAYVRNISIPDFYAIVLYNMSLSYIWLSCTEFEVWDELFEAPAELNFTFYNLCVFAEYGSGRVAAIGCPWLTCHYYMYRYDNYQLLLNIIRWLSFQEPCRAGMPLRSAYTTYLSLVALVSATILISSLTLRRLL